MTEDDAKAGSRVRLTDRLDGLPPGTEGVIEHDYGRRIVVRWELGTQMWSRRDEFDKERDLALLDVVGDTLEASSSNGAAGKPRKAGRLPKLRPHLSNQRK